MLRKLSRLGELSSAEWLLLPQLVLLALGLRLLIRIVPLPRLTGALARGAQDHRLRRLPLHHRRCDPSRLAVLADLAARVARPQGRCLTRSLLLFFLLKARDEAVELRVGITREAAALQGHAWIEKRGTVFADSPQLTGRFATLLKL